MNREYIIATKNSRSRKSIVGIDEAGRGPLAGPVAVGVFVFISSKSKSFFNGVKDSKKLSEGMRNVWFDRIKKFRKLGQVDFAVTMISNRIIDRKGIVYSVDSAIKASLDKLKIRPNQSRILLDGGLKAPKKYFNQKTIIRGDEKVIAISLASIVAKVTRDRKMVFYSKKYPKYEFDANKGYGTKRHLDKLKRHGVSPMHRKSFLKNFDNI